jgi:uncharacterized membrane protein YjfL (UPF0719 family)
MIDILREAVVGLAYGTIGIALLGVGYVLVDLITPGRLATLIWTERNMGAAIVLAAKLLGIGIVVATAILASETGLTAGLASTAVYGLIGIALMTLGFFALDLLTPGRLGDTVVNGTPAAWVTAAAYLSVAAIVAAAIY